MDYLQICEAELDELRQKEAEYLITFTAQCYRLYGQKIGDCDCIAWALVYVMRLYEDMFRRLNYGGLVSTKHIHDTQVQLAKEIGSKYSASQVKALIDFCIACSQGQISLSNAESNARKLLEELLDMRPDPEILPRESYWKLVWEGED